MIQTYMLTYSEDSVYYLQIYLILMIIECFIFIYLFVFKMTLMIEVGYLLVLCCGCIIHLP
jgi:hypothetical protein